MENGRSSKNLKELIIISILLILVGIVIGLLNLGQVNETIAKVKIDEKEEL